MTKNKTILITGGAGFIGSHLTIYLVNKYPDYLVVNLDKLTYAGNLENLKSIENKENYHFIKGDITDSGLVENIVEKFQFDGIFHLAAESHVDRSIQAPNEFAMTNIIGTLNLLNAAKNLWKSNPREKLFYHISTDEVYGSLGSTGLFRENTPYDPRSPYSASKASSDHFVRAYFHTYDIPVVISNCSNNYGPFQFPEKLIPLMINNILHQKNLPVYGDGKNVRDWLYVEDHISAMDLIFHSGKPGETYNIGGENEMENIELVYLLCDISDELLQRPMGSSRELITFVKDRPGHDRRYAIDTSKIKSALHWEPATSPEEGFRSTVQWYLDNRDWLKSVTSGDYKAYYDKFYGTD
nr:dTDP-glucose 4,6-dehydratase [Saprospiraceae bacterium]